MSKLVEKRSGTSLGTTNDFLEFGRELVIDNCIGETLPLFLSSYDESELSDEVTRNAFSKVYAALRKLDEPIVVLCGVKFNREQFRIWNDDTDAETNTHDKDNPLFSVLEGKSDFTILGPNYLVLIEVSEMKSDANVQMFKKDISIKMQYQKKSIELIEKILSRPEKSASLMKLFKTFSFICFPLIEKDTDFLDLSNACPKQETTGCITRLELEEIQLWWDTNVKNQISARNDSIGDDSLVTLVLPVLLVFCSVRDQTIESLPERIEEDKSEKVENRNKTQPSGDKKDHETNSVIAESKIKLERDNSGWDFDEVGSGQHGENISAEKVSPRSEYCDQKNWLALSVKTATTSISDISFLSATQISFSNHTKMQFRTKTDYIENGRPIFEKYCLDKDLPLFFPNKPSREILPLLSDLEQRKEYDNVNDWYGLKKVHKILASLKQPVLVLCDLRYNHNQFHLWDPDYDPEACAETKTVPNCSIEHRSKVVANNNFLLFGPDYVVIIDVHSSVLNADSRKVPDLNLNKKISNQQTSVEFIRRIASVKESDTDKITDFKVFRYIAFPLADENKVFLKTKLLRERGEKMGVIWKKDLNSFDEWWADNIISSASEQCEIVTGKINNFYIAQCSLIWKRLGSS